MFCSFPSVKMIIIATVIVCEGCLVISYWVAWYFIYFIIMFVCLPQLVWNSSACRKHVPGKT